MKLTQEYLKATARCNAPKEILDRNEAVIQDFLSYCETYGYELRAKSEAATPQEPAQADAKFIAHIQSHLKPGEKVICKICGRTAEEITDMCMKTQCGNCPRAGTDPKCPYTGMLTPPKAQDEGLREALKKWWGFRPLTTSKGETVPGTPYKNVDEWSVAFAEILLSSRHPESESLPCDTWLHGIREERKRQDAKWGEQNHDVADYYTILGEEFGEIGKAICETKLQGKDKGGEILAELVQTAAVCVAMLECITRNNGRITRSLPDTQREVKP